MNLNIDIILEKATYNELLFLYDLRYKIDLTYTSAMELKYAPKYLVDA